MDTRSLLRLSAPGFCILLCIALNAVADKGRMPDEVRCKSGYVNPVPKPPDFTSAMLWGIAIADTRTSGYENAQIEIAQTQLTCRVDARTSFSATIAGNVRGGRHFWPASPRAALPAGHVEGCTLRARVKISPGASL